MSSKKKEEEVQEEALSNEEILELKNKRDEALKQLMERKVFLADMYVKPHTKPARRVKEEDLERVLEEAPIMHEMCMVGRGEFSTAFAIAHTQINDEDPLRYFVNSDGQIFINPVIVEKGHEIHQLQEGCMSYPEEPFKTIIRFKEVTVKYRTIGHKVDPKTGEDLKQYYMTKEVRTVFKEQDAQIMQHECQHLNGSDIYQPDSSANKAFFEPVVDTKTNK